MGFVPWKRRSVAAKLIIAITSIVVVVVTLVTLLTIQRERRTFQTELEQQAVLLLSTLSVTSADALFSLDADFLVDNMQSLGALEVLTFGQVYDPDGRIIADALDVTAGFRLEPDSWGKEVVAENEVLFDWQDDQLVVGQAVGVRSRHFGGMSIGLSTKSLELKIAAVRAQGFYVAATAVLAGLILAFFLSRTITDPLQEMIVATEKVTAGDLTQHVAINSGDELATLGTRFNQMTEQLQQTLAQMEEEIDERKKAEAEAEIAREFAEEANRAKSTFLANMSHELRTPLSAIIGYCELLIEQVDMEMYDGVTSKLGRIQVAGHHLSELINEVLDLSKIEAGKMVLHPGTFAVSDFIENVVQTAIPLMNRNQNDLVYINEFKELDFLYADEGRLRQIMLNLLSNAAKFTENGHVTLTILRELSDGQDWVQFKVSDTGNGILPEQLEDLFKPFVQLNSTATHVQPGTGLGLTISQQFAEMMGGRMGVESVPGQGSHFSVYLPIRQDPEFIE